LDRPSQKLDDHRYDPFEVRRKVGQAAYELRLLMAWKAVHPVFHDSYLTPYRESVYMSQQPPPHLPSILVDREPEFEVEQVLDERARRGRLKYLVC
jgi:hypothetical protein